MPADVPARTPAEAVRLQYLASATGGTVSAAARADYAAVLASEGHENRAYELGGDKAFTLEDLAAAIAARTGTLVRYRHLPERDFAQILAANGLPQEFADIIPTPTPGTRPRRVVHRQRRPAAPDRQARHSAGRRHRRRGARERRLTTTHPARRNGENIMRVEIWGDVVCPWCYIATARFDKALAAFPHREEVEVVHRSFELHPGHDRKHVEPVPAFLAKRYGPQGPDMDQQIARLARREGLEYRTDRIVGSTLDAHRLLHLAKDHGLQHELLTLLFRANFAKAESIFTRDALHELAAEAGLDPDQVRSVLGDPNAYLAEVRADEQEAAHRGASGVPYFLLDDGHSLSGAQPVSAFTKALLQAWEDRAAQDEAEAEEFADAVCGPDGTCAIPGVHRTHEHAGLGPHGSLG